MGADMLLKTLSNDYEILRFRSSDEIKHVPELIFVNLSGLESSDKIKAFENSKIFLLGNKSEVLSSLSTRMKYVIH